MRSQGYRFLISRSIRRNPGRNFFLIFGAVLSAFFLTAALVGHFQIRNPVLEELNRVFPEKRIVVKPKTLELGPVQLNRTKLNADIIRKIENLPGVEAVYPVQPLLFPVRAEGTIFGQTLSTDVVVNGSPPALVEESVAAGFDFKEVSPEEPLPVLISQYFLDLYNLGLAPSNNLPKFNKSTAVGQDFNLILGESTIAGSMGDKVRSIPCQVVGFTPDVNLFGIIIPLSSAHIYNTLITGDTPDYFSLAQVQVEKVSGIDNVIQGINALGLRVETNRDLLEQFQKALNTISFLGFAFAACVLIFAVAGMMQSESLSMISRRGEIGLMHAVGATRQNIRRLFYMEKIITGLAGGIIGAGIAYLILALIMKYADRFLQDLPFLGEIVQDLRISYWIPAAVIFFSVIWGIVVEFIITNRPLRTPPARLMKK